jgi:hypothetical protein
MEVSGQFHTSLHLRKDPLELIGLEAGWILWRREKFICLARNSLDIQPSCTDLAIPGPQVQILSDYPHECP